MSYVDEIRKLVNYAKISKTEDIPVRIVIDLTHLPSTMDDISNHRCVEYHLLNSEGEQLISGQGWSLDDAFKEAKQDFFNILIDD